MKNIKFLIPIIAAFILLGAAFTSCGYDDFVENEFDYTAVYLPHDSIYRTFIMEEGMRIGVGVVLGGVLSNTEDVEVTFSLIDTLTALPEAYYSFVDADGNPADSVITIPAGSVQGFVYVQADSAAFLADPLALGYNYSLGFQLESVVNADSILASPFDQTIISFTYINELYGNFIQSGQYTKTVGDVVETNVYPATINDVVLMEMKSPTTMKTTSFTTITETEMYFELAADNNITISSEDGSITDDGGSYYDPSIRTIYLNYTYEFDGATYTANDTLQFRNREVDGVNQYNEDLIEY